MASWRDVAGAAPELAQAARAFLDGRTHKTLATLRRDGSPRISGTEAHFVDDDLWFGAMWRSRKALDLQRDPRFALHSGSVDPPDWTGDAKIAGRAEEITEPVRVEAVMTAMGGGGGGPAHLFRAEVTEVVVVRLADARDRLVIEFWREGRGVERLERS